MSLVTILVVHHRIMPSVCSTHKRCDDPCCCSVTQPSKGNREGVIDLNVQQTRDHCTHLDHVVSRFLSRSIILFFYTGTWESKIAFMQPRFCQNLVISPLIIIGIIEMFTWSCRFSKLPMQLSLFLFNGFAYRTFQKPSQIPA